MRFLIFFTAARTSLSRRPKHRTRTGSVRLFVGMATPAPIGLPRRVMARVLAMRPETLSRALRRLEADGAIDASADIRILDRERLKAASQ